MQKNINQDIQHTTDQDTSLKELVLSIRDWIRYFLSKWYIILLAAFLGGVIGLIYAISTKPVYTATTSFVLETGGKGNALSAYAGIASSIGLDIGSSGGGLFEGDNILELYRSRNMISRALLSETIFYGKKQLLIDRYIEFNNLREKWSDNDELKNIRFNQSNAYSNSKQQLLHDSIMFQIVKTINKSYLSVNKIDKKLNIIEVKVANEDELFAKKFNESLVANVNRFYLDTKSKKSLENVAILQGKTDSVRSILSGSIYKAAAVADATPNQNLTRMAQRQAPILNARVNSDINQQVLGTLLQNLELSKIALLKEAPLIQIVDDPILPLEKKKTGKLKGLILGAIMAGILTVSFLFIKRVVRKALSE